MFAMFSAHLLRERMWSHPQMYVTTFTGFALQQYTSLYGSTMYVATLLQ